MNDAAIGSTHDQGLGVLQGRFSSSLVASGDGFINAADLGAHGAFTVTIDRCFARDLAHRLFGGNGVGHTVLVFGTVLRRKSRLALAVHCGGRGHCQLASSDPEADVPRDAGTYGFEGGKSRERPLFGRNGANAYGSNKA